MPARVPIDKVSHHPFVSGMRTISNAPTSPRATATWFEWDHSPLTLANVESAYFRLLLVLLRALARTDKKFEGLSLQMWASKVGEGGLFLPLSTKDQGLAVSPFAVSRGLIWLYNRSKIGLRRLRANKEEVLLTTYSTSNNRAQVFWS